MTGRPESLFPLFSGVETLPGIGPKTAKALEKRGIFSPKDLVLTLPVAVIDRRLVESISDATASEYASVDVTIVRHIDPRSKGRPWRVDVTDTKTAFQLVFLHAR